jgi:tetratricopeptide (TPR) repeat protein
MHKFNNKARFSVNNQVWFLICFEPFKNLTFAIMKMYRLFILFIGFQLFVEYSPVYSQDRKMADAFFESGDFESAYEQYGLLSDAETDDLVLYRTAVCVLNLNMEKKEAVTILEKLVKKEGSDPNAMYLLARAFQMEYNFDEAIQLFTEFEKKGLGSEANLKDAGKQIDHCKNAMELMKFPMEIQFENLGAEVNSPFSDYYPFASTDETYLFFNSRKNSGGEKNDDGKFASDIYVSESKDGKYQKAVPVNKKLLTKEFDEEIVGLSSSNLKAVIYSTDKSGTGGKLSLADVKNKNLYNPIKLPDVINTRFDEISASVNNLSKEIYFASNKPGGYGGTDLYVTRLLPNGDWGEPQNLGPTINTIYDEDFPVLSNDGKILYFSSNGLNSMGGYDIFKADYDQEKMRYINPRNLGYPLNTPMDEMNFSISESGRYGYISAYRKEGYGDLDIYRVTFNDIEPDYTVINGNIILPEGKTFNSISMIVTDDNTGELYGEYLPNLSTMRYVIILPPGKFTLSVETDAFEFIEEKIEVLDKDAFQFEIKKDITLK